MNPDETRKQMFDVASDATKQLITVATGVITATAVFSKDLDSTARILALFSWIVLTVSVMAGLAVLFNITGALKNALANSTDPNLSDGVHFFSAAQLLTFLAGTVLVVIFGYYAATAKQPEDNKTTTINCVVSNPPAPVIVQVPGPAQQSTKQVKGKGKQAVRK